MSQLPSHPQYFPSEPRERRAPGGAGPLRPRPILRSAGRPARGESKTTMSIHSLITPEACRLHHLPPARPLSPHLLVLLHQPTSAPLLFAQATPRRLRVHLAGPAKSIFCPLLRAGFTLTRFDPGARTLARRVHGHRAAVRALAELAAQVAQHFAHKTRRWPASLDPAHLSLALTCTLSGTAQLGLKRKRQ
jgi:hypothetical protein